MKVIRAAALVAAAGAAFGKVKEYARENPGKAADTIDKAESFVRGKAGPKYADKVGKGSQALRQSLGLPQGAAASTAAGATPVPAPTDSAPPGSGPTGSAPTGSGPDDSAPPSSPPAGFDPAI